jgi:D-inositol-3-phosphate glycosyltransferase
MDERRKKITVVDTIGKHSGVESFNEALVELISDVGYEVDFISNFTLESTNLRNEPVLLDYFSGGKLAKISNLSRSYFRYLGCWLKSLPKSNNWWIYQSYGLRLVDGLFLLPLLLIRRRLLILVHDVYSITSPEPRLLYYLKKLFYRWIPHQIIVMSSGSAKLITDSGFSGILLELPHFPARKNIPDKDVGITKELQSLLSFPVELRLLIFGSIRHTKGIDIAIKAIAAMEKNCQRKVQLIIAGRDSKNLLATSCYQFPKCLPVHVFDKFVSKNEQAVLFSNSHILLLPYREVYQSGVLAEAIAYRLPVLCSELPSFREVLDQFSSFGTIFGHNAEDLSKAITAAVQTPIPFSQRYRPDELFRYSNPPKRKIFIGLLRSLIGQ